MLHLLERSEFDASAWEATEASLAASFVEDFGGTVVPLEGGVSAVDLPVPYPLVIVSHPFEDTNENAFPARLAMAVGDAEMQGIGGGDREITFADTFNLVRRPGWVAARAFELT